MSGTFLLLTEEGGRQLRINVDHIAAYQQVGELAYVNVPGAMVYGVTESARQIDLALQAIRDGFTPAIVEVAKFGQPVKEW